MHPHDIKQKLASIGLNGGFVLPFRTVQEVFTSHPTLFRSIFEWIRLCTPEDDHSGQ